MRALLFAAAAVLAPMAAAAAPAVFDWAYPQAPTGNDSADTNGKMLTHPAGQVYAVPGSDRKFTWAKVNDNFAPADWHPDSHPSMPGVVARGRAPHIRACSLCHLPNGHGHSESASLAGLPYQYIVDQMRFFRDRLRVNDRSDSMTEIVDVITADEIKQSASYFAGLKPVKYMRVIESTTAPASHAGSGGTLFRDKGNATVPVGPMMIYEIAENDRAELRDDQVGYVDYVPVGAVAKGRTVALGNLGAFRACASCHGDGNRGQGNVPQIAGRAAYYLVRQLHDMKIGGRRGAALGNNKDGSMADVVGKLSNQDIVNVAAYMASLDP